MSDPLEALCVLPSARKHLPEENGQISSKSWMRMVQASTDMSFWGLRVFENHWMLWAEVVTTIDLLLYIDFGGFIFREYKPLQHYNHSRNLQTTPSSIESPVYQLTDAPPKKRNESSDRWKIHEICKMQRNSFMVGFSSDRHVSFSGVFHHRDVP